MNDPAPGTQAAGERLRYERGTEEFGRFLSFTDGVIAIALTLLILGIDVPKPAAGVPNPGVLSMVGDLWPQIFAYLLSFVIIALYWLRHSISCISHRATSVSTQGSLI